MTIGPVQLLVLGFSRPDFQGEIRGELQRLKDNDWELDAGRAHLCSCTRSLTITRAG